MEKINHLKINRARWRKATRKMHLKINRKVCASQLRKTPAQDHDFTPIPPRLQDLSWSTPGSRKTLTQDFHARPSRKTLTQNLQQRRLRKTVMQDSTQDASKN